MAWGVSAERERSCYQPPALSRAVVTLRGLAPACTGWWGVHRASGPPPPALLALPGRVCARQLLLQLFPIQRLPHTDDVLLIIVQRPKTFSRLEYIKCLLEKDFMRLVTTKSNLNFNSQGRIFFKDHKMLFAVSYGFNIRLTSGPALSRQILLHMWAHLSNMHLESLFVFSSPAFLILQKFFFFLTWSMENEIIFPNGKKDLALRLRLHVF